MQPSYVYVQQPSHVYVHVKDKRPQKHSELTLWMVDFSLMLVKPPWMKSYSTFQSSLKEICIYIYSCICVVNGKVQLYVRVRELCFNLRVVLFVWFIMRIARALALLFHDMARDVPRFATRVPVIPGRLFWCSPFYGKRARDVGDWEKLW